jgi:hypothetical protein
VSPRLRVALTALVLGVAAAPASAQHGELQLGGIASYGPASAVREGAGVVAGIALGRLVYAGVRWVYHAGSTESGGTAAAGVTNRAQQFLLDLGLMVPFRGIEIVPGVSLGAVRFTQRDAATDHSTVFAVAPSLSVHVYLIGVVVIPEVLYLMARDPELRRPVAHRTAMAALRVVIPIEVRRIRY